MHAQQLVFLRAPPSGAARRGRRRGRHQAKPGGTHADRLWSPAQPLRHVLQRVAAGGQVRQTLTVLGAPAPGVGAQTRPCYARLAAVRQLRSDLGAGSPLVYPSRISASSHAVQRRRSRGRWTPSCWACRRTASGERPSRSASAASSPRSIGQTRIKSSSWGRSGRGAGRGPASMGRRERTRSTERPRREASSDAGTPAAVPARTSASSWADQGLALAPERCRAPDGARRPRLQSVPTGARSARPEAARHTAGQAADPPPNSSASPRFTSSTLVSAPHGAISYLPGVLRARLEKIPEQRPFPGMPMRNFARGWRTIRAPRRPPRSTHPCSVVCPSGEFHEACRYR